MANQVQYLASLAASGTANVVIPVAQGTQDLSIHVAAEYAAVSLTSGIQASFNVSPDGSTYVASNVPTIKVAPAAATLGEATAVFRTANDAFRADALPVEDVKIVLTNLDGTNAAVVAVTAIQKNYTY